MQSEDMDIQIYIASNGMAFEKVDKDMIVARFLMCWRTTPFRVLRRVHGRAAGRE
jgi:hypothetical protein